MSLIGERLGDYQIVEEIGRGGMAVTYRAYQSSMDRQVAIKIIRPELAERAEFGVRFLQEVRLIANLEHPRILPVYDHGQEGHALYLVMRYVPGGTLRQLLRTSRLTPGESARIVGQVAAALDYAHSRGVLHLDLKPSNVLVDLNVECYLADFGIAQRMGEGDPPARDRVLGTPEYMSPEHKAGEPLDVRSDVYSLGAVAYELLVGEMPFCAEKSIDLRAPHAGAPLPMPYELPPVALSVLSKSLAVNKADRFTSAGELAEAFTAALLGLPLPASDPRLASHDRPTQASRSVEVHASELDAPPVGQSILAHLDMTWFCGLCGASLDGFLPGQPCRVCRADLPRQKQT